MLKILKENDLTENRVLQALSLDHLCYAEQYHLSSDTCIQYFRKNPHIYTMVIDTTNDTVIGYINISPVKKSAYDLMVSGKFVDTLLSQNDILPFNQAGLYSLYLSSVVIHPDYRNKNVLHALINAITEKLFNLAEKNIFIVRTVADALTPLGCKICKSLGMRKVLDSNHGSSIYEIKLLDKNAPLPLSLNRYRQVFYRSNPSICEVL